MPSNMKGASGSFNALLKRMKGKRVFSPGARQQLQAFRQQNPTGPLPAAMQQQAAQGATSVPAQAQNIRGRRGAEANVLDQLNRQNRGN